LLDESDQIAVIRGLRDGNREAWTALYDGYCADVWRFVGRLMGNRAADVADVVQEIFLAAARAARQFDSSRGTLWSWLAGIAHNQVSAFWRQAERTAKFRVFADADSLELWKSLDGCRSPDRVCEQRELVDFVRVILAQLSPDYTALLIAKYADEETLEELARRFGISVEATKSKLARARREFRATFESITRESKDSSFVQHRRVAPRSERDSKA
jgi:RNA polymerase sigma-70 factor, ECF subfamily